MKVVELFPLFNDLPRSRRPRILRTYRRIAFVTHDCDRCLKRIEPGDEYEAEVVVIARGNLRSGKTLIVRKYHANPECDFPEEPDFEDERFHFEQDLLENRNRHPNAA